MDTSSEQATVEIRIDWENNGIRHHNRDYFEKISFWRDFFPGALFQPGICRIGTCKQQWKSALTGTSRCSFTRPTN